MKMKNRYRLTAVMAACFIALSMAACGSDDSSSSKQDSSADETTSAAESKPEETTASSAAESKQEEPASEAESSKPEESEPEKEEVKLEYWAEDSKVAQSIRDWVAEVTDPNSDKFIPVEDRIVVSDVDGTLIGELYPAYFDYCQFVHRALYDDTYKAPEEMKEYARYLEENIKTRTLPPNSATDHAKWAALAYKDMTPDELIAYSKEFMNSPAEGFENLTRGEAYYKPMCSLVKYLEANNFTVYAVSGTDRTLVRAVMSEHFEIPYERCIGTDVTYTATGKGDTDGLDYTYKPDDKLVFGGEYITKNLKFNKVWFIAREIGKVPVLALGNSSGDLAMGQYTVNNSKYDARAYMLLCDDTERDYGKLDVAEKFKKSCEELGFTTVSMKNDFATIYGDDIKLSEAPAEDESASEAESEAESKAAA